jgi:Rrf2 family protein
MKLSTKARYGLALADALASRYDEGFTGIAVLSNMTGVSEGYLAQILNMLKRQSLIETVRGAAGGYRLAGRPIDITIGQVVRATEDDLNIIKCIGGDCGEMKNCKTSKMWKNVYDSINGVLDKYTLEDLKEDRI